MIIGYVFTLVYSILLAGLLSSAFLLRKTISQRLSKATTPLFIVMALMIIIFFILFSILYVSPVEQLYFDDNIYQGIALNILHHGNALWCQYGTALLTSCPYSQMYHDPVEISFYIAIAFAVFGVGAQTAYGLSLLVGAASILIVFLLGSMFFGKKAGLASAVVFALIPELFIWSRTQAVPDLIFMMFSLLTFLAYEIYRGSRSRTALTFFLFALGIAVYSRIEAMLLVPIFIALAVIEAWSKHGFREGLYRFLGKANTGTLIIILFFFVLITPEIYYISSELHNPNYGSGSLCGSQTSTILSISNFKCNIVPNTNFFLGTLNGRYNYPAYFSVMTTIIAVIGALYMIFGRKRLGMQFAILGLWVLAYHFFYDAFYAGSVLFGVDVRFMLVIYPAISIFAGYGIAGLSDIIPNAMGRLGKAGGKGRTSAVAAATFVLLIVAFSIFPFYNSLSIITMKPSSMPQESMPLSAVNFIYQNAQKVPNTCLVFSFTPDVWWALNKSAAQVGWLGNNMSNFTGFESGFSCFVFDKGYWCTTPDYKKGTCSTDLSSYNTTLIASAEAPDQVDNYSLVYLNGYKT